MSRRRVVVTVGELNLHGFDARQRYAIADAVEAELMRRFASFAPGTPREVARVDAGVVQRAPGAPPAALGAQIAQLAHDGVTKSCNRP